MVALPARRFLPLLLPAALLTVIGVVAVASAWLRAGNDSPTTAASAPSGDSGFWAAPPDGIESLVSLSDVVVIGSFTKKVSDSTIPRPGIAELQAQGKLPPFAEATAPISFFELAVERYVVGSGPDRLVIGQLGTDAMRAASDSHPSPVFRERAVLFLVGSTDHPGRFASTYGPWGRLVDLRGGGVGRMGIEGRVGFASDSNIDALGARAAILRND